VDPTIDSASNAPLWPLAAYLVVVVGAVVVMVAASCVLGGRHRGPATGVPYESGIRPTGSGRVSFPVDYYLVAVFFVIFDLESVFLYAWAVAVRQAGWFGFAEAVVFVGVLAASLVYLWRVGGLDWSRASRQGLDAASQRGRP
jgi:NADH-quinone oxidoreductase subunit A